MTNKNDNEVLNETEIKKQNDETIVDLNKEIIEHENKIKELEVKKEMKKIEMEENNEKEDILKKIEEEENENEQLKEENSETSIKGEENKKGKGKKIIGVILLFLILFLIMFLFHHLFSFHKLSGDMRRMDHRIIELERKLEKIDSELNNQKYFDDDLKKYIKEVNSFMRDSSLEFDRFDQFQKEIEKSIEMNDKFHKALKEIYFGTNN